MEAIDKKIRELIYILSDKAEFECSTEVKQTMYHLFGLVFVKMLKQDWEHRENTKTYEMIIAYHPIQPIDRIAELTFDDRIHRTLTNLVIKDIIKNES